MRQVPTVKTDYGGYVLPEPIGLSEIPLQLSEEVKENGFVLNILAVGRRCLGTSTLINALFAAPLVDKSRPNELTTTVNEIEEDGVRLKVSVTTFHGDDYEIVQKCIEERFQEYYESEQGLSGKHEDKRFHVCFFAVPLDPLRPNELKAMASISRLCNLVPVITRADTYVEDELAAHRAYVRKQLAEYEVEIFEGSEKEPLEPSPNSIGMAEGLITAEKTATQMFEGKEKKISHIIATIASERTYDISGSIIRGRKYPWGFIDTSNESYSDFKHLQRTVIQTNYDDLIWITDSKFYNEYRQKLSGQEQPALQKKRLKQLLEEMERILKGKHQVMLEELEREEQLLNDYFPNNKSPGIADRTHSEEPSQISVLSINRESNKPESVAE